MIYGRFINQCKPGSKVANLDRTGTVIKISKDHEKALVRFSDGMTEWVEYYKLNCYDKRTD